MELEPKIAADEVDFYYGTKRASMTSAWRSGLVVTAFIGPSRCGKSVSQDAEPDERPHPGYAARGSIKIDGQDIYAASVDVVALRRRVGMVFQKSNPFPKSIFEMSHAARIQPHRERPRRSVASRRGEPEGSGTLGRGQGSAARARPVPLGWRSLQQRLCIARALAIKPDIVLMDEPASALDPIATQRIEELIYQLKDQYDRHRHA